MLMLYLSIILYSAVLCCYSYQIHTAPPLSLSVYPIVIIGDVEELIMQRRLID